MNDVIILIYMKVNINNRRLVLVEFVMVYWYHTVLFTYRWHGNRPSATRWTVPSAKRRVAGSGCWPKSNPSACAQRRCANASIGQNWIRKSPGKNRYAMLSSEATKSWRTYRFNFSTISFSRSSVLPSNSIITDFNTNSRFADVDWNIDLITKSWRKLFLITSWHLSLKLKIPFNLISNQPNSINW